MKTKFESVLAYARPLGNGFFPVIGSKVISNEFTAQKILGLLLQAKRHQLPTIIRRLRRRYK